MPNRWAAGCAVIALAGSLLAGALLTSIPSAEADHTSRTPTPTRTPRVTPTPTPKPGPPLPPVNSPADGPGIFTADCPSSTSNGARITFLWGPSNSGQQWLDLSVFNDGFAPGTFVGAGPFTPTTWGFTWIGLLQGTTHFARVNTLTAFGWRAGPTFAFYTPICNAASLDPSPADDMLTLRDRLANAIANSGINAAVAITDLRTRETVEVLGDDPRLPGCTINLFALILTVVDLQDGRYEEPAPGALIGGTIYRSDPITARTLMKYYVGDGDIYRGMERVNTFIQALGMTSTLMDHPPAFDGESLYGFADNVTTARDVNRGLQALWDARAVNEGWRDYVLGKMTNVKPGLNYLIPAGVGYGSTVSHKNGFLYSEGWADNDIGIVWYERSGQRYGYAISFFTQNVRTKYADIPVGQQISSIAYQWFVSRYGYP